MPIPIPISNRVRVGLWNATADRSLVQGGSSLIIPAPGFDEEIQDSTGFRVRDGNTWIVPSNVTHVILTCNIALGTDGTAGQIDLTWKKNGSSNWDVRPHTGIAAILGEPGNYNLFCQTPPIVVQKDDEFGLFTAVNTTGAAILQGGTTGSDRSFVGVQVLNM